MPSTSPAQARLMRAVSRGWHKPGGGGPSVAVAKDFVKADQAKGTHMKKGGMKIRSKGPRLPPALANAMPPPPGPSATDPSMIPQPPGPPGMKKGGKVSGETVKGEQGPVHKNPLKGEDKDAHGQKVGMKHGGHVSRGGGIARRGFASGGSVRGDGIAERGHTRGRFV